MQYYIKNSENSKYQTLSVAEISVRYSDMSVVQRCLPFRAGCPLRKSLLYFIIFCYIIVLKWWMSECVILSSSVSINHYRCWFNIVHVYIHTHTPYIHIIFYPTPNIVQSNPSQFYRFYTYTELVDSSFSAHCYTTILNFFFFYITMYCYFL